MFNLFWFRATSTNCGAKLHHIFLTNKFLGHFLMFVRFSYLVPTCSSIHFSIAFSHFSALHSHQLKCEKYNFHLRAKAKTRIVLLSPRARMRIYIMCKPIFGFDFANLWFGWTMWWHLPHLALMNSFYVKSTCYLYVGLSFHVRWNVVPFQL